MRTVKRIGRWVGWFVGFLLLLILLTLAAAWYLLGTESGFSQLSSQITKRIDGLETGQLSGHLGRGVDSDRLSFSNDSLAIDAAGVDTEWRLSCLRQREFCLDRLVIDELTVQTFATDQPADAPSDGPITLPDIALPIDVILDEVLIRRLTFKPPGDAPEQVIQDIRLSAHTEGSQLTLDTLQAGYQDYAAQLEGTVTLEGDYPLDLTLNLEAADLIPETLPEGEGAQPANVTVNLSNTLRDLRVDTQVSGAVQASLTGRVQPLEKNLPVTLELRSPQLGWPLSSNSQVQAVDTLISIDGTLEDYQLNLNTQVSGEQVPDTRIDLSGQASTERLTLPSIRLDTLGGTAVASASLSWTDGLQWQTQWQIDDIDPSLQLPEISGRLDAELQASGLVQDGNWTIDVPQASITGVLRDYPFDLDAVVSKGLDDVWRIDTLTLNNGENQIDASGQVTDEWDIEAALKLPQLQNILPELAGGFTAELALSGPLATPDVNLSASSSVVGYNDIVVQGVRIDARINELFVQDSSINVAVGTVQAGEQTVQNIRLALEGQRSEHRLTLFADGPQATSIDLAASGSLNEQFDWQGLLERVELEVPAHIINLDEPTELAWNNARGQLAIDAHCWVTEGSRLCLQNQVLAEPSGTAMITLDQYALSRLNPFLPAETTLEGSLSMDATVDWGESQPGGYSAIINTRVTDGGARVLDANDTSVSFNYEELTLTTRLDPQSVDATLSVSSTNLGQADISVQMDPSGEEKPIQGTISLQGLDIGIAKAFLPDFDVISGSLNIEGNLSGQLTDPRFDGDIILDRPELRAQTLPLPVTGGRIVTTVRGKRALIDGRLDSDEGVLTVKGNANWQQLDAWRADVTLNGENLNVETDPVQQSLVNHQIRIGAQPGSIRVTGDVTIPMAVIDVEDLPQGAASVSGDVVVIEDIEETDVAEESRSTAVAPGNTRLVVAINVELGDEVRLSAYGLNARLTGDMSVRINSPNPPQLGGEIEVVDGIYKQYGQNLKANGQILFVGPVNQTRLDIDAIREIESEDRIAGLHIDGTVAQPEITLFTEPGDKSEDAILSYIVLGRDINEASDQEANLLATAALALTVRGGRNIAGGIASALGVEDFALETRGSGDDTEVVVSGRLNDRLLLRYGRSVFEPESTLYLRYDLTKKLYLEAAQGANRAVDLFYSFSF